MMFTAILPMELNGVRRQGDAVRRHTFWWETEFTVSVAREDTAPVVMSWNAAFDERHRYLNREEWGPYPYDGQQVVRHFNGAYWRQCLMTDVMPGDFRSEVLTTASLEAVFTKPTRNDLVNIDGSVVVGPRKPVVRERSEFFQGPIAYDLQQVRATQKEENLAHLANTLLIVGDTVYRKCAEPVVVLSDSVLLDRQENELRLLKIETDKAVIERLCSKRPDLVVPIMDFDTALQEAPHGFDPIASGEFNDIRRPNILRPDLISDIDVNTFRAISHMRIFKEQCFEMEMTQFAGPCGIAHRNLIDAFKDFDANFSQDAVNAIEDCLEECTTAFAREYYGKHLKLARQYFDRRPVSLDADITRMSP